MLGFKYYLFSPHFVADAHLDKFNQVYETWKISFTDVVESAGGKLDPDDFFRNDLIGAITYNNEVVGLSTMTMFDLRLNSSLDHHYIKALSPETPQKLLRDRQPRLISIEYLNVLPNWRKNHSPILWTEVLIGLGLKLMDQSPADIIMGTPRTDVKVLQVCKNLEAIEVQEPILKMNYPCAVVIFPKQTQRKFKNSTTAQYVEGLWHSRIETGAKPFTYEVPNKKAS
ncbi:MAG: hypothetical protein KUL82_11910 [Bdellovibrio sp.]|nr:hypothetical protein [Bdellovibrio sp.]